MSFRYVESANLSEASAKKTLEAFNIQGEKLISWYEFCQIFIDASTKPGNMKTNVSVDRFMDDFVLGIADEIRLGTIPVYGLSHTKLDKSEKKILSFGVPGVVVYFKASDLLNMAAIVTNSDGLKDKRSPYAELAKLVADAARSSTNRAIDLQLGNLVLVKDVDPKFKDTARTLPKKRPPRYGVA